MKPPDEIDQVQEYSEKFCLWNCTKKYEWFINFVVCSKIQRNKYWTTSTLFSQYVNKVN